MDVRREAYKYAVKNAALHSGKADLKAVIGKLIALDKGMAKNLKNYVREISEEVDRVNNMGADEIRKEFEGLEGSYELKPREKEPGLKALEWAEKGEKVVTRFAPNPNGPMHLGSARAALMSYEYAEKYGGKFILRFDDTDPKVKKPIENPEKLFREDLGWLGARIGEVFYASDRLEIYYGFMKGLVEMGKAYVCRCERDKWKGLVSRGEACDCRGISATEHMERFKKMLSHEFKEGEAVLRLKTDLKSSDPSLRDWWMAKIVDEPEHHRVKETRFVWPSYNFASAVDDHELGITLIIRGQEHAQNAEKQGFVYEYFGWKYPHAIHTGRVKLNGMVLSTSEMRRGIEEGRYSGWDDPRLGTIQALRTRGFHPKAILGVLEEVGVKTSDTTISMKSLEALNKKLIDRTTQRLTFIEEPVRLDVQYCREMTVEKANHPDYPEQGVREYEVRAGTQSFLVSKKQLEGVEVGEIVRLRGAINCRVTRRDELQAFAEFVGVGKINKRIISWVLEDVNAVVVMPDNSRLFGVIDADALDRKPGGLAQLEQLGYGRIHSVNREKRAVEIRFTHP